MSLAAARFQARLALGVRGIWYDTYEPAGKAAVWAPTYLGRLCGHFLGVRCRVEPLHCPAQLLLLPVLFTAMHILRIVYKTCLIAHCRQRDVGRMLSTKCAADTTQRTHKESHPDPSALAMQLLTDSAAIISTA